ncbi:hypothetical protein B0A50_04753 [Salinomyces thailandicus]|uniref:RNA-dependent RNA polymerase n=1 Tax=Salinomyces thailandicus TaxID=706561 RepID=A0A4U0TXT6_9PEZI|nr:hypothetical protein B0A50_04753 [Salinomyces thailandica]
MDGTARQRQGLAQAANGGPRTPGKSGRNALNTPAEALTRFATSFDITLPPIDEKVSPSKRSRSPRHEIARKISMLSYRDSVALERVFRELCTCTPAMWSRDDFLSLILARLTKTAVEVKETMTPRSKFQLTAENLNRVNHLREDTDDDTAPPSPTLEVKHGPKNPVIQASLEPLLPLAVDSRNTSFRTSFTSDRMKLSQETAPTSVDSCSQASQYSMVSLPFSTAAQLESMAKLETKAKEDWATSDAHVPKLSSPAPQQVGTLVKSPSPPSSPIPKHVAREPSPPKTPTKPRAYYRIESIPKHGLVPIQLPLSTGTLPFELQLEAYRVMRSCKLEPADFDRRWQDRSFGSLRRLADEVGVSKGFRKVSKRDFDQSTLCARLHFSDSKSGPVFDFELLRPRKEHAHSFERKWGRDRILSVDIPNLLKPPDTRNGHMDGKQVKEYFQEMLKSNHMFAGRTWFCYHLKAKTRKPSEHAEVIPGTYSASFFALDGPGLESVSVAQLTDWWLKLRKNRKTAAAKIFSRLDLGQSRTVPTLTFAPDQIIYDVPDKMPTSHADSNEFRDFSVFDLTDPNGTAFDPDRTMNDGCSEISVAAMASIAKLLELDYIPTAVQARIFGAKGLWFRSPGNVPTNPSYSDVWIKISRSQIKVKRDLVDMNEDLELRTLNVVKYSEPAKPATLPPGFLTILEDRGVPARNILDAAEKQIEFNLAEFHSALDADEPELHDWMYKNKQINGQRLRTDSEEKIMKMLEAGFRPKENPFLRAEVMWSAKGVFDMEGKSFRLKLGRSTNLFGLCDPLDVLQPGQVCVNIPGFRDPVTGEVISNLHGRDIIVSRNPGRRNSDMQKVRVVSPPELAHLQNVIVFSAKGRRPPADMLSGGDYDGDTFWLTWYPELVDPFRNAPAPWRLPTLSEFGITQDTTTLQEDAMIPECDSEPLSDEHVRAFIHRRVVARMEFSLLPIIALDHGSLIYWDGGIRSQGAKVLCDLHDIIIDSDKQGLTFHQQAYVAIRKKHSIPLNLQIPAHRKFTKNQSEEDALDRRSWAEIKDTDIIDRLYFHVVKRKIDEGMARAEVILGMPDSLPSADADLTAVADDRLASDDPAIVQEMKALCNALKRPRRTWQEGGGTLGVHRERRQKFDWAPVASKALEEYLVIQPVNPHHPAVAEWLRPRGQTPTIWAEIKASTLARLYYDSDRFIFAMASGDLCHLKSMSRESRFIRMDMYLTMKQHRRKTVEDPDDDFEDDDGIQPVPVVPSLRRKRKSNELEESAPAAPTADDSIEQPQSASHGADDVDDGGKMYMMCKLPRSFDDGRR